ncbi:MULTISPECIES: hypothetical protein [unclassified Pseudoalteromonas]|uniref:hypothetical protein n=1 Tax=unclassified Pseudoalteromonas TaxID=194690 RepID=UPI00301497D9
MELKAKLVLLLKSGGGSLVLTAIFFTVLFQMSAQFHHEVSFSPFASDRGVDMMLVYSFLLWLLSTIFSYFFLKMHAARHDMHVDGLVLAVKYGHLVLWAGVVLLALCILLFMQRHVDTLATAKDETTAAVKLEGLIEYFPAHGDVIDVAVAQNPATPRNTLIFLSFKRDFAMHLALLTNPSTPKSVLEEVLSQYQGGQLDMMLNAVMRNPKVISGEVTLQVN